MMRGHNSTYCSPHPQLLSEGTVTLRVSDSVLTQDQLGGSYTKGPRPLVLDTVASRAHEVSSVTRPDTCVTRGVWRRRGVGV